MNKEQFLNHIKNNNMLAILYGYHIEQTIEENKRLSYQQFIPKIQALNSFSTIGIFDLNSFTLYVKNHYLRKFEISILYDRNKMPILMY